MNQIEIEKRRMNKIELQQIKERIKLMEYKFSQKTLLDHKAKL